MKEHSSYNIIEQATNYLSSIAENPRLESEILLADLLQKDRTDFYKRSIPIDDASYKKYQTILSQRHLGMPLAYLTGKKEFWSVLLKVNEHVLIPRPETELLVEQCLLIINNYENPSVLELGTGSGAISIALAKEHSQIPFTATDLSTKALDLARQNAIQNHVTNVSFKQSDWFQGISEQFSIIVSNPPYVDRDELTRDQVTKLYYEPEIALYADDSGQSALSHIIKTSHQFLNKHGFLLLEHGYNQQDFCQKQMHESGYTNVVTYQDSNHLPRVTMGQIK